jgi:hypothetical protein
MFPKGVDYIFAMAFALGIPVSSLYGVPSFHSGLSARKIEGSHGITPKGFTVIPESSFQNFF